MDGRRRARQCSALEIVPNIKTERDGSERSATDAQTTGKARSKGNQSC